MQDFVPKFLQPLIFLRIPFRLAWPIMNSTVDFNNDANFMTIKVDNVAINRNLTAKFQPQGSAILQLNPGSLFRSSVLSPHLASAVSKDLRGS